MPTDKIVRLTDVLEALGEEPAVWDDADLVQVWECFCWRATKAEIDRIMPLPFGIHQLTEQELHTLHGDPVIVSAPGMDIDKKIMVCLGCHKDMDGHTYIVLDGAEHALKAFKDGAMKLYTVV